MTVFAESKSRIALCAGTALAALAWTGPLSAQEMGYEERVYEYAQPAAEVEVETETVDYRDEAVVQPLPRPATQLRYVKQPRHTTPAVAPVTYAPTEYRTREVYVTREAPAPLHQPAAVRTHHQAPVVHHQPAPAPVHALPPQPHAGLHHAGYDRQAWLDECRDRIGGRRGGGGIVGGLLGAVAGGVIGNRVYDSERLAGTLIGAGVGGLAGLAIGSAIAGSGKRRAADECEAYLEQWEYRQRTGGAYYGGGYAHHYTYVPVTIAIPQRAVVREYVTTEVYTDHEEVVVHEQPAPRPVPVKRVRYIKGK